MVSKPLAFGLVAAACIAAAGGGAYIATLQHARHDSAMAAGRAPADSQAAADRQAATNPQDGTQPVAAPEPVPQQPAAAPPPPGLAPPAQPSPDDVPEVTTRVPAKEKAAPKGAAAVVDRTPRQHERTPQSTASRPAAAPPQADSGPVQAPPPQPAPIPAPSDVPDRDQQPVQAEPERAWEELTVPRESVLGLQLETPLSSESARIEDRVDARVTREVRVDGHVAIPAGTHAIGTVTMVERGGKIRERARLGVRFNTLILADSSRLSITTDTVFREGEAPSTQSSAKIGGAAIGGAIIGAILGGGKGAAIGTGIGAAGGTAAAMAGDRHPVVLPAGTPLSVRIQAPVTVTVEK